MQDGGTTIWTVVKDGHEIACQARLTPYGIDIDIHRDSALVVTRTFETDDEALAWANKKRDEREAQGWRSKG
jgi:hypothetical protein